MSASTAASKLMETDDPSLFSQWTAEWSDLVSFEIDPFAEWATPSAGWLALSLRTVGAQELATSPAIMRRLAIMPRA